MNELKQKLALYLSVTEEGLFHSLIAKSRDGEWSFIAALGYEGGGEFAEFYGKFGQNSEGSVIGQYSSSLGSGEWEKKILDMTLIRGEKRFQINFEDLYEFMSPLELKIQSFFLEALENVVSLESTREFGLNGDRPKIKGIDMNIFREGGAGVFVSQSWTMEWLEVSLTEAWPLSLHFPGVADLYC